MTAPQLPRSRRFVLICVCVVSGLVTLSCSGSGDKRTADQLYAGLTPTNREQAKNAVQKALETRLSQSKLEWRDGQGELKGSVTPLRTFKNQSGDYCREYREVVYARPSAQAATRIACRNGDGIWEQVKG